MSYLLDTHVLLWWTSDAPRLSKRVADIITCSDYDVYVSAATAWEMAIKQSVGKLNVPDNFQAMMEYNQFKRLDVTLEHALHVAELPRLHSDPFDRLLIAQAILEDMTLITNDRHIRRYDVSSLET